MNNLLLRRRMMMQAGGSPTPSPLPAGYTQKVIGVTSGQYYINLGILTPVTGEIRIKTKLKYHDVSSSLRQLNGTQFSWFGCDRGPFNYSGSATDSTPAKNTPLSVDILYDIDVTIYYYTNYNFGLFNLGSPSPASQCYMDIEDYIQIYNNNDILIFNYIPCSNPNNIDGVYDTISQTFKPLTSY